jgi:membrane protease YdiL (CAAX protease family)
MGIASGLQIAFFTFAGLLLAVPLTNYLESIFAWSDDQKIILGKSIPFVVFGLVLVLFPALRRRCRDELSVPIPSDRKPEVILVAIAKLWYPMALAGGLGLWYWSTGGSEALGRRMLAEMSEEGQMVQAFSTPGLVRHLFLSVLVAPVLEELVFRGFLYRAWERRWGWVPAMLLTSVVFGLYHSYFLAAFFGSIIFVCLLRRTGTLWAPITVHALFNLSLWHPLMGRHVFPKGLEAQRDISQWKLQIACLMIAAIAIPAYVWLARKPYRREAISSP